MKIGVKLTIAFFLVSFLSMLVIGLISYYRAKQSLEQQSFDKLTAVREIKAEQIEDYFQIIRDQISIYAGDPETVKAMNDFKAAYHSIYKELKFDDNKLAAWKKEVDDYTAKEFMPRLNKTLSQKASLRDIVSGDKESILLHKLYYVDNPYPVGEKLNMVHSPDSSSYAKIHAWYHPIFKKFLEKFGYYDLFLIDDESGNIVYSVYKEADFATSLKTGPFKNTNLAEAFNAAARARDSDAVKLVDFKPYHPSYNESASFIACPVFEGNKRIGVLAFQMPIDRINRIMTSNGRWADVGLGKTGETYIVGGDYTIRNQSRFLIEDSVNYFKMLENIHADKKVINEIRNFKNTIGLQQVKTKGTEAALSGVTDTQIFPDYRGVEVLSAYTPLKITDMNWVLMSEIDEAEAFEQVIKLRNNIIIGFLGLLAVVFAVSLFVSREITRPVKELTVDALELANGNLDVHIVATRNDEIGLLASGFQTMQSSIKKLIGDLRHINQNLEEKVMERTAEVTKQKNIIEEKQKEVLESIHYARRIQSTILAHDEFLRRNLPEHFVLFKPKDIVSGDFYWATRKVRTAAPVATGRAARGQEHLVNETPETKELFYLAVCDSTGHGVPGAFMSLLNISFLNEAINEKNIDEPHEILNHVRKRLIKNISHDGAQDGMDGIVMCFDKTKNTITYAAAHNTPVLVRNNDIIECGADKMPVGKGIKTDSFALRQMDVKKGDMIYLYTDGYADQFGGPKGKKFKYKTLNALLAEISRHDLAEQREKLNSVFDHWKGLLEQIDDVCIIGVRI